MIAYREKVKCGIYLTGDFSHLLGLMGRQGYDLAPGFDFPASEIEEKRSFC